MTTDELARFRARLVSAVIDDDRRQGERERKKGYRVNIYRLGIILGAAAQCCEDIEKEGITAELAFADNFTPTRENHKTARALGLLLDVQRGRWVALDAAPN